MVDATAKLAVAGAGVELRLLSGALCARRAKLFLYGFLFAFVACTAYLAFNPNAPAASSPFFARFFSAYPPSSVVSDSADSLPLLQLPSLSPAPPPAFPPVLPPTPPALPPATAVVSSGARVSNFSAKLMGRNVTKPAASPRGLPGGNETAAFLGRSEVKNATARAGVSQTSFNQSRHGGDGGGVNAAGSGRDLGRRERGVSLETMKRCDLYDGNWVKDESYPLYRDGSCPLIDEQYDCFHNGRRDKNYLKYRWQPNGCNIPRLNATDLLERLRGRRMVFVGDSLNRNMWESLVCILRNSVKDKKKVFEVSGRQKFRSQGAYSFIFQDYNCSVEFFWSPFLVQEWAAVDKDGSTKETLRLDLFERNSEKFRKADVVVFNTGHWWTHEKTSLGKDYYQEGNHVYSQLNVVEAFRKAMVTWVRWVDINVDPHKTVVFFRGYSASHFSGGQWNSGGACDDETVPINNDVYLTPYPEKMKVLETVLKETKKTAISYMNITRLTDYRKDGHPSVYRKRKYSAEEKKSPLLYQDCSHWCLPGVPDSWNELLYAELLIKLH